MEIFKMVFSPIEVNTYVLADKSGDCAIIDCGCYDKKESEELEFFIKDKHINPVLLLNTHCHLDHVFGNKFIIERYGLRTFSSELDEMNRKDAKEHAMLLALHVPGHTSGSLAFYSEKTIVYSQAMLCLQEVLEELTCQVAIMILLLICLLYTSDAADEEDSVDLGGRR